MTDYEWLTEMGLCHRCRKEKVAPGKKYCFDCLDKIREEDRKRYDKQYAKDYQSRRREIYREKIANGICVRCSRKATHGIYCYEHSIHEKRRMQYKAEERKRKRHDRGLIPDVRREKGLCLWCGKPTAQGKQCCERHSEMFSDAGKRGYEANLINKNNHWINEVEAWKRKNN